MPDHVRAILDDNRCLALLASLVVLLVLGPALDDSELKWVVTLFHSVVFAAAIVALTYRRSAMVVGLSLGAPYFLATWGVGNSGHYGLQLLVATSGLAFYGFVMVAVLAHTLRGSEVTRDKLFGAACGYLLLGLAWAFLYVILEIVRPGSFNADQTNVVHMLYFSYTTLTTLGYGDVTPESDMAKSLAVLQAATGVMYTAMLIARLVSMYRPERDASPPAQSSP